MVVLREFAPSSRPEPVVDSARDRVHPVMSKLTGFAPDYAGATLTLLVVSG